MQVELQQICKSYSTSGRTVHALRDVSVQLTAGDFLAVTGPSGCGKSTLLMVMGGLLQPDAGCVRLGGRDVYRLSAADRARLRAESLGFVFQQFHLVPYLTVWENVLATRLCVRTGDDRRAALRAEELLERWGMAERRDHLPGQLSTGEKQRTALARAVLNEPQVLLADEPTGNLDAANSQLVLAYLAEFSRQGGITVLVTHDPEASRQADKIMRLHDGQVVAEKCSSASGEG